ncbi:MAG: exodeoxyribonuclease VII small subunit [Clostridiales bacterium]|jgi:exodeoxyribonuclease VII small subunit|nr:exodeoxyribonuclease VII small subunit [Clostridiales bacterium]
MASKPKTYEKAFEKLEEIIGQLEEGAIDLERSVKLYKEGMELSVFCARKLDAAEETIITLRESAGGVEEVESSGLEE